MVKDTGNEGPEKWVHNWNRRVSERPKEPFIQEWSDACYRAGMTLGHECFMDD